jgi:hypothetical protein
MVSFRLYSGESVLIDEIDTNITQDYRWFACRKGDMIYAVRNMFKGETRYRKGRMIYLHTLIAEAFGMYGLIDHRDLNGLNNQRHNLRQATHAQNMSNRPAPKHNTTGYKGVYLTVSGTYLSQITVNGKYLYLGTYYSKQQAATAYNIAAKKYFGKFAYLNIIKEQ